MRRQEGARRRALAVGLLEISGYEVLQKMMRLFAGDPDQGSVGQVGNLGGRHDALLKHCGGDGDVYAAK